MPSIAVSKGTLPLKISGFMQKVKTRVRGGFLTTNQGPLVCQKRRWLFFLGEGIHERAQPPIFCEQAINAVTATWRP